MSRSSYPTEALIGSINGRAIEVPKFTIITRNTVTVNVKSQTLIEKPIDHQVMTSIQVLVREIHFKIGLVSKEIVE